MTAPIVLHRGDCLDILPTLPADHFDAVVTDPPYHLTSIVKRFGGPNATAAAEGRDGAFSRSSRGFMGETWDGGDVAFRAETWAEVLRVLKPGGHVLAFNHSRTFDQMGAAIRAAGFEVRDSIWRLYDTSAAWQAFLDSLDPAQVAGLYRALAGDNGAVLAWLYGCGMPKTHPVALGIDKALGAVEGEKPEGYSPITAEAKAFAGHGTALKPAIEPIFLARKPLAESSVPRQYLATGTGGVNIDDARIEIAEGLPRYRTATSGNRRGEFLAALGPAQAAIPTDRSIRHDARGRYPANVVTDGSAAVEGRFPVDADGVLSRFFYSGKAAASDRDGSDHPTVKPQSLMRWLVRLATARGGLVLDPFGGSGSTAWAAVAEGRRAVLIEKTPKHADHIEAKIARLADPAAFAAGADPAADPAQQSLF